MSYKKFLTIYKTFFALLGFSALLTEIAVLVERNVFNLVNFFSFFTVESNVLVVFVLLASAIATAAARNEKLDQLRAMVTVYILVVGIGFSFLLAGLTDVALTAVPWDNTVLHYIIPAVVLVDYLIDRPTRRLSFKRSLVWLSFPAVYLVYSLTRGAITGWYPYPFLNGPVNGYETVAVTAVGLFVLGIALIWCVCRLSGRPLAKH